MISQRMTEFPFLPWGYLWQSAEQSLTLWNVVVHLSGLRMPGLCDGHIAFSGWAPQEPQKRILGLSLLPAWVSLLSAWACSAHCRDAWTPQINFMSGGHFSLRRKL